MAINFSQKNAKPTIIAGPCMAESWELLEAVSDKLVHLAKELEFDLVFKASFDKANRTSINSYRGPGIPQTIEWFEKLKSRHTNLNVLTDVHETYQIEELKVAVDIIQIPAFLCRQTDLIVAAVKSGKAVNIKKGQFLAPENCNHIISKVLAASEKYGFEPNYAITERGITFGYGNLIVDMRGLKTMSDLGSPVIFDVTHSLQLPAAGGVSGEVSGGLRSFAPVLCRSAAASGYVDGFFIEVHTDPDRAKSDASTQLSIGQAESLLRQIIPIWNSSREHSKLDKIF